MGRMISGRRGTIPTNHSDFKTFLGRAHPCILPPPNPGTVQSIHRHRKSSETVVCLRGRLVEEFYDELERTCTERIELSPGGPVVALNVPAGQWHTVTVLESGTVILEMKDGPYEPIGPEDILAL